MDNSIEKFPAAEGEAGRAQRMELPISPRLRKMRFLSRLLDNSILLPGGYRIGLDPIIGLVPGVGDIIATSLSLWIVYQGAVMGISKRVLLRMIGNVAVESLAGSIPILGDIFDAAWKANARNMQLVEQNYHGGLKERNPRRIFLISVFVAIAFLTGVIWLAFTVFGFIFSLFS